MKGILLLNGQPYCGQIDTTNALVYCCDGAYRWANGKVRIDQNIGDFDSLDFIPDPPPLEVYPSEKDYTDGELALLKLLEKGVDEVEIYGGFGGREDHFFGNLHLLYVCAERGVRNAMISEESTLTMTKTGYTFHDMVGKTVSVFPFGSTLHILKGSGFHYPYPQTIAYGQSVGLSNIVEQQDASIQFEQGVALICINKGKV